MRRAFTLIELLAVVAIIATMVAVGVVGLSSGKQGAQIKAATRDVYAAIRNARSRAIVTGRRVNVKFGNEGAGEEGSVLKVDIESALEMKTAGDDEPLQEYFVTDLKRAPEPKRTSAPVEEMESGEGETIEQILFAPMESCVVKGMRLKFQKGEEIDDSMTQAQHQWAITVFSTSDYVSKRYGGKTEDAGGGRASPQDKAAAAGAEVADDSGEVVWETNGSVEPHRIWVYPDGMKPEEGMMLSVDRFGGIKVLRGDGTEEGDR